MTILPLVAPAFCLWVTRGAPARWFVAISALALLLVSARIPLSAYTRHRTPGLAVPTRALLAREEDRLRQRLARARGGGRAPLTARGGPRVPAAPRRSRSALPSCSPERIRRRLRLRRRQRAEVRGSYLPADARWVDHADVGPVTYLQTPGGPRELAFSQMFWNRSIGDVVRLPHGNKIDAFHQPLVRIADDGSLVQSGDDSDRDPDPALLRVRRVPERNLVADTPTFDLWRADGTPQLAVLVAGRFFDGWLANDGWLEVLANRRRAAAAHHAAEERAEAAGCASPARSDAPSCSSRASTGRSRSTSPPTRCGASTSTRTAARTCPTSAT